MAWHPTGHVAASVADPVHLVDDGHPGVATTKEVGVQRVDMKVAVNRPGRGDESLPSDLSAVYALAILVRAVAPEDVVLDLLQVQEIDQAVHRALVHQGILVHNHRPVVIGRIPIANAFGSCWGFQGCAPVGSTA